MGYRTKRGGFTEAFKRSAVLEFEAGKKDIRELSHIYGIKGHSTILKWCRRYGGNRYPIMRKSPIKKDEQTLLLLNQVKLLERELKEARLKQATLETLIDIAERHYSIDIKKNTGGKPSIK